MVHVGQELTGSGNYLRFIRTATETDGELLEMESTYREGAAMPATRSGNGRPNIRDAATSGIPSASTRAASAYAARMSDRC